MLKVVEGRDGQMHTTYATVGIIITYVERMLNKNLIMFKFLLSSVNIVQHGRPNAFKMLHVTKLNDVELLKGFHRDFSRIQTALQCEHNVKSDWSLPMLNFPTATQEF